MDFADLDKMMDNYMKAGMAGPVVMALGNDSASSLERWIADAFNLPLVREPRDGKEVRVAPLDNPRFEQLIVEALSQLFEHAKANHWPEIVILPYDEPTERLMPEYRRLVKLFREHFPKVRLYGVTMNRLEWAKMVSDADVLSTNGDFARIIQFDRENGKTAWFYGSNVAAAGFGDCRASYGLARYIYHPDGSWFWSYNFHVADPWNEFDGATPDSAWVICWPALHEDEPSVSTLGYEGLRAGVNDVRYAMALEDALKAGKGPAIERVGKQYDAWRQQAQRGRLSAGQTEAARLQLIEWLLQARGLGSSQGAQQGSRLRESAGRQPTSWIPRDRERAGVGASGERGWAGAATDAGRPGDAATRRNSKAAGAGPEHGMRPLVPPANGQRLDQERPAGPRASLTPRWRGEKNGRREKNCRVARPIIATILKPGKPFGRTQTPARAPGVASRREQETGEQRRGYRGRGTGNSNGPRGDAGEGSAGQCSRAGFATGSFLAEVVRRRGERPEVGAGAGKTPVRGASHNGCDAEARKPFGRTQAPALAPANSAAHPVDSLRWTRRHRPTPTA